MQPFSPPPTPRRPSPHERTRQRITSLAANKLGPLQTWRLHRHLRQCETCRREWDATRSLFADLSGLPLPVPARPAPLWPAETKKNIQLRTTVTLGGITMQKRTAFAALALTVFSLTGAAFAAGKLAYNPFTDMTDAHGHILRADSHFSGEVKLYDRDSRYIGSFGTDGQENAPLAANVQINGGTIAVKGAGRHALQTPAGELIGYADLIPQSAAQRAHLRADHEKAMGHEEVLRLSSGCDDGWGTTLGFFGGPKEGGLLTWRFSGVGEARFLHNGKVVRAGIANPVTPSEVEGLRQTLAVAEFQQKVRVNPPSPPVFEWTAGGVTRRHTGYTPLPLTLPNGTALTVEFLLQQNK